MPKKTLFGIELEWKLSLFDLTSLFISILTAAYVSYNFFRGPRLEIAPPPWMVIWAEDYGSIGVVLSLGSEMTYLNVADPGYNAAIHYEFAEITFGGKIYRFEGRSQVVFENPRSHPRCGTPSGWQPGQVVELEDGSRIFGCHSQEPKLHIRDPQRIDRVILGASGTSHETEFAPARAECAKDEPNCVAQTRYLPWKDFVSNIKEGDRLSFDLGVRLVDGTEVRHTCVLSISKPALVYLADRAWHYFSSCES